MSLCFSRLISSPRGSVRLRSKSVNLFLRTMVRKSRLMRAGYRSFSVVRCTAGSSHRSVRWPSLWCGRTSVCIWTTIGFGRPSSKGVK